MMRVGQLYPGDEEERRWAGKTIAYKEIDKLAVSQTRPALTLLRGAGSHDEAWHEGAMWHCAIGSELSSSHEHVIRPRSIAPLRPISPEGVTKYLHLLNEATVIDFSSNIFYMPSCLDIRRQSTTLPRWCFLCAHDSSSGRTLAPCKMDMCQEYNLM